MKRQWWHDKIAYQIYPKSFCDSNGDGIGDLQGIISKLDYLKELGVDIIWLSPCYPSPFADQGYDISDYYNIDPRIGTLDDMDELIAGAKARGMHILMDLVVNHCSDEHEWFRKACKDPDGTYGKYFYIEDRDSSGSLPCNWRSAFGGPCWEPLPGHPDKQYLHIFHKKQPDLNWENPVVREEVYKIINWWLDRGISGFRIDAIINIKKLLPYRDFPADRDDGLCNIGRMLETVEGVGDFLGEMRDRAFAPKNALTIGEVFSEKPDEIAEFIGDDGYFSSMFDFAHVVFGADKRGWYAHEPVTTENYKQCVINSQKKIEGLGYFSNVIENHDRPRCADYYLPPEGRTDAGKKCIALAYYMLKGLPFIYEGQEIGMENIHVDSIDEVDDVGAIAEYEVSLAAGLSEEQAMHYVNVFSRDNSRTPVQWDDSPNAGFTSGEPWLRVNPNYTKINVRRQDSDPDSVLNYYRKLAAIRKAPEYRETLTYGKFVPVHEEIDGLLAYIRDGQDKLLVMANLNDHEVTIDAPYASDDILINNMHELNKCGSKIVLEPWQACMLKCK